MDAEAIKEAYQEAVNEATGVDAGTAHQEGITAAAMMVSAMDGLEDADARSQVEAVVG